MIKAVVFDLDDTLIPEIEYVKSGFMAVARCFGDITLGDKLYNLFCEDKKDVYQRAGFDSTECQKAIEVYRKHKPQIKLEGEVITLLDQLKHKGYKLGIITDGRPEGQRNKIEALQLDKWMDYIIITDELGGETFRKPNPYAYEIMRKRLGVEFSEMMYVGDNPRKDFYIGSIHPVCTVRLMSGNIGMYGEESYYEDIKENIRISKLRELVGKNYV